MKRSEINKALKELEAMCENTIAIYHHSAILHRKNGKLSATNTMKFVIVCSVGTLQTSDRETSTKQDFPLSQSATETVQWKTNIQRCTQRNFYI